MTRIVLDPGHGGTAKLGGSSPNNAVGPTGLLEKTVTLDVAKRAAAILAGKGHEVRMTRTTDVNLGLSDRAKVAKSWAAPVFLSIHLNGFNKSTQGTETICDTNHLTSSGSLCRAVQKRMVAATGHADRNKGYSNGVKVQSLGVLKPGLHHPTTACCLLEISFMDVAAEEARLKSGAYLDRIARAVSDGISDYIAMDLESGPEEVFGDGFEALALEGTFTSVDNSESAAPQAKAPRPRVMHHNDRKEFSQVDIGAGFDPDAPFVDDLESTDSFDLTAFRSFVKGLGLRHFSAEELLFLGSSNAPGKGCADRNSMPPKEFWNNITNTAQMLDEIRHRLGASCRVLSAYRSPAYNSCVGGETQSLHMRFNAIDFRCLSGTPTQWRDVARAVRSSASAFTGGIGTYGSFVYVDTRGKIANWVG